MYTKPCLDDKTCLNTRLRRRRPVRDERVQFRRRHSRRTSWMGSIIVAAEERVALQLLGWLTSSPVMVPWAAVKVRTDKDATLWREEAST